MLLQMYLKIFLQKNIKNSNKISLNFMKNLKFNIKSTKKDKKGVIF